jgi:hypothetical protein
MAGPILTFLDNLQDRQPVRNAVRGVFGLPQRRSTVIDPMEEMAARDAERGGDISNPFPNTRMPPRIASTATDGPGVAAALPAPAQAIDETQPYQGMGMIKGMTTSPAAAIRERRQMAARPVAQGSAAPASLSQSIGLIHQSPDLPPAARAQMLADLMYRHAADATDNDRRETLVRIGDTYMKQFMVLTGMERGEAALQGAKEAAQKLSDDNAALAKAARKSEERMQRRGIRGQLKVNQQIHGFATGDTSRATSSKDYTSALVADPTMPVSMFANQARGAMELQMFSNPNKPVDPALLDAEYQRAFDRGFNVRLSQLAAAGDGDEGLLHPYHPMFNDIAQHYRGLVQKNPESYDQLQLKLAGQISAATSESLTQKRYPQKAILEYAQGLATDILGPKPARTGWLQPILGY